MSMAHARAEPLLSLELPFPDKNLLPNAARRLHWRARAAYTQTARMVGYVEAANVCKWDFKAPAGELCVSVVFHEPNKQTRDLDGMLSACKPLLDGIAQAMGVDDKQFNPIVIRRGEVVKGGCVKIAISDGSLNW